VTSRERVHANLTDIVMPEMGSGVREGTVVKWLKAKGDRVTKGDFVVEIMVEKVSAELEAPSSGVIDSIAHAEGETVPVGAVLASILEG
jgi:pyruvate dehydrogenase E2 component (dihydrolipoamide acetyltransferase)